MPTLHWCPGRDSNSHADRRQGLGLLRLPFRHPGLYSLSNRGRGSRTLAVGLMRPAGPRGCPRRTLLLEGFEPPSVPLEAGCSSDWAAGALEKSSRRVKNRADFMTVTQTLARWSLSLRSLRPSAEQEGGQAGLITRRSDPNPVVLLSLRSLRPPTLPRNGEGSEPSTTFFAFADLMAFRAQRRPIDRDRASGGSFPGPAGSRSSLSDGDAALPAAPFGPSRQFVSVRSRPGDRTIPLHS